MSMYQRVVRQLERLAAEGPKAIEAVTLQAPQTGYLVGIPAAGTAVKASLNVTDYDRYSVMLRHLEMYDDSRTLTNGEVESYLRQSAAVIVQRLTYLEEPLALLEWDTDKGIAQLRSGPPQHSDEEIIFWEAYLWGRPRPRVRLARWRWRAGDYGLRPWSYPITLMTLARIAEDLAVALRHENGDDGHPLA